MKHLTQVRSLATLFGEDQKYAADHEYGGRDRARRDEFSSQEMAEANRDYGVDEDPNLG